MALTNESEHRYVEAWITNEESGRDFQRIQYIDPYVRSYVEGLPDGNNILDVGCGWGKAIESLKPNQRYTGLDPHPGFLEYVRRKYPRPNLTLLKGGLPQELPVPDEAFDAVLCSMVLHCVSNARTSIDALFSKAKQGANLMLVTFAESCRQALVDSAARIDELDEQHFHGMLTLASGYQVETDITFHPDAVVEERIAAHGTWTKQKLNEFFVAYECVKD